ncbi:unnamed protein product, partial [Musa hybrid cultivar]
MRSKQLAASAPRPHAPRPLANTLPQPLGPMRGLAPRTSTPRPHARLGPTHLDPSVQHARPTCPHRPHARDQPARLDPLLSLGPSHLLGRIAPEMHLRDLSVCVVLLGRMALVTTPARSARLRRATRSHDPHEHACAVCPSASCSSALRLYATRDHTCSASPPASCSLTPCSRDRPTWPTRLCRAPWPHVPETYQHGRSSCAEPPQPHAAEL